LNDDVVFDESSHQGDFIESLSNILDEDGVADMIPGDAYTSFGGVVGVPPF
jgi:hypothetical protein